MVDLSQSASAGCDNVVEAPSRTRRYLEQKKVLKDRNDLPKKLVNGQQRGSGYKLLLKQLKGQPDKSV